MMDFTNEELVLIIRALKARRVECCNAIDFLKKTIGKDDPAYPGLSGEYYSDIQSAADLIDKIRGTK